MINTDRAILASGCSSACGGERRGRRDPRGTPLAFGQDAKEDRVRRHPGDPDARAAGSVSGIGSGLSFGSKTVNGIGKWKTSSASASGTWEVTPQTATQIGPTVWTLTGQGRDTNPFGSPLGQIHNGKMECSGSTLTVTGEWEDNEGNVEEVDGTYTLNTLNEPVEQGTFKQLSGPHLPVGETGTWSGEFSRRRHLLDPCWGQ